MMGINRIIMRHYVLLITGRQVSPPYKTTSPQNATDQNEKQKTTPKQPGHNRPSTEKYFISLSAYLLLL
jgi:hypothetical protein